MRLSLTALWLLLNTLRLESVRPVDQGPEHASPPPRQATQGLQQHASFVEVGTRHFEVAKHLASPPGEMVLVYDANHKGNQVHQDLHDEWSDEDLNNVAESPEDDPPGLFEDQGPPSRPQRPAAQIPVAQAHFVDSGSEDSSPVVGKDYQSPNGDEVIRPPSLHGGFSSGSSKLDHVAEEDNAARLAPSEDDAVLGGGDPLFVPLSPELSHRQRNGQRYSGGPKISTIDNHEHHFEEYLNWHPAVDKAVESYKANINHVKADGNNVLNELDGAVTKVTGLYDTVTDVDKNVVYLGDAMNSESRASGIDSVKSFQTYNENGVEGSDKNGFWDPNAGKWNVFKDLLFPNGKRVR